MPLSVRTDSTNLVYELVVETGLPGSRDVAFPVFDLRDIAAHGATFQSESTAGAVKRLSGGTIAVGLLTDARGSGTADFVNQYADDEITDPEEWALVLDHSMVDRYVSNIDISSSRSDLRNVSLDLDTIAGGHLEIDATGDANYKNTWWPFEADVEANLKVKNAKTSNSKIIVDYHITDAKETRFGTHVTGQLSHGQRNGKTPFLSPAYVGDKSDPVGRLHVTNARTENGEVILEGEGTRKPPTDAAVQVTPNYVTIGTGCSGNATSQKVTVKNPKSSGSQVDLAVCDLELGGRDQSDFSVGGLSTPVSIPPGSKRSFTVSFTRSQLSGTSRANLEVETSAGTETLPLRAYLNQGTVDVPGSVSVVGEQVLNSCLPPTNRAQETFSVTNTGTGGVEFCTTPQIVTQSGGNWNVDGPSAGEVIGPGKNKSITVTFSSDHPNQRETATLEVVTSAGTDTVSLTGEVKEAESGQSGYSAGGIRIGPFAPGAATLCLEPEKLGVYLEAAERIMRQIRDVLEDWEEPKCGPRMLCPPGMGFTLNGFPEGTRVELRDPVVGERAWFEPTGDDGTLVTPVPLEGELELDIDAEETVDMNRTVNIDMRHGRMMQEATFESEVPLTGVATDGTHLVATTSNEILVFGMDADGSLEPGTTRQLEVEAAGLAVVDDLVMAHGANGSETFLLTDGEIRPTGTVEMAADVLVPDRHGDRERVAYAVREGDLSVVDVDSPGDPDRTSVGETSLEQISAGYAMGDRLALAGDDGVEVWSIRGTDDLQRRGAVEIAAPAAIFCDDTTTYALTEDRTLAILRQTDEGLTQVGGATLPDEFDELLPRGSPAILGERAAIRTADCSGINVVTRGLSRLGEVEGLPESELDFDEIPEKILEAASQVGRRIEGVYEPRRR